jgi:hypothetical protein
MKQIPLTKGKFALVDDEDYDRLVAMGKWHVTCKGYAARTKHYRKPCGRLSSSTIFMHHLISPVDGKNQVDHRNTNKLDNQKDNLRVCSNSENCKNTSKPKNNTSGFKGVYWKKQIKRWCAQIGVEYKNIYIGSFATAIEAAKAYNEAAVKHFGEFAKLNQI